VKSGEWSCGLHFARLVGVRAVEISTVRFVFSLILLIRLCFEVLKSMVCVV
jgi:hypothetical protein